MVIQNNEPLRTSDTALSAYLMSVGFNIHDIEYNGTRAYFIFLRDDTKIEKYIKDFDTARARGNIVLFFNAYQNLLRRIKERY